MNQHTRAHVRCRPAAAMVALAALFAAVPAHAVIVVQGATSEIPGNQTAFISIENNDTGVTYNSLKFDSQLADLLWQAHGVADNYSNDFSAFVASGVFGYFIDSVLSQVKNSWFPQVNADGTLSILKFGGDDFSTGKTMTGNYYFNSALLDADNDGHANYTFHLLSAAQAMPNFSSPFTLTGVVGANLNGNFLEAETLLPAPAPAYITVSGQAYALVPTDAHPAIPEPAAFASGLGVMALAGVVLMRRRRRRGKCPTFR